MDRATKKQIYFGFILVSALLLVYFLFDLFFSQMLIIKYTIIGILVLALIIFIFVKTGAILFLEEYERAVVFRFGKLNHVSGPGWALIIPGIDKPNLVDLRVQTIDIPRQEVVTKDSVMLDVDAILYLKVNKKTEDIVRAVINVEDYKQASQLFVRANIRDVIGQMELTEVISNINDLNVKIRKELEHISKDWGIVVDSVEIKEVKIPDEIIEAMHKQKSAIQKKLATIEEAQGEHEKIKAINEAASNLSDKSVAYYYIKALEEMSKGESTKIIFPMEFSRLANIVSGKIEGSTDEQKKADDFISKYGDKFAKYLSKEVKEKEEK